MNLTHTRILVKKYNPSIKAYGAEVEGFFNDIKTKGILPDLDKGSLKLIPRSLIKRSNQAAGIKTRLYGWVSDSVDRANVNSLGERASQIKWGYTDMVNTCKVDDFRGGTVTPLKDITRPITLRNTIARCRLSCAMGEEYTAYERQNNCLAVLIIVTAGKTAFFIGYSDPHLSIGVSCSEKNGSDSNQLKQDDKALRGELHSVENQSCELPIKIKSTQRERGGVVAGSGERCGILGLQLNLTRCFAYLEDKKKTPTHANRGN